MRLLKRAAIVLLIAAGAALVARRALDTAIRAAPSTANGGARPPRAGRLRVP
jgi:hypothetical protein